MRKTILIGWLIIKQTQARWAEEDGDQRAAAFAYYFLLSLLPLSLLLLVITSLFIEQDVAIQAAINMINHYTPLSSQQERETTQYMHEWLNARGQISLTAVPFLLWGAMKYLRTLVRTTNRVWQADTYNWWRLPLKSLGLLGITVSAVLIGILLPTVAGLAEQWFTHHIELPKWAFALIFRLIPGLVLFYGLIMIYKTAPSRATRFSEVWLGALFAAAVLWLSQWLFMFYAANLANFDALYGALGGIMAFLLWLYLSSCIGVLGICLCAARAEVREQSIDDPV